jgi:hypothetical protein
MTKPNYEITKLECDAFDTRVVERHIKAGRIDRKEVQTYLDRLPDEADEAEEIIVGIGEVDGEDDDSQQ